MTTPRWSYDFGEVIAAGIEIDPEQRRVVSEGGLVLTFWPLLLWGENRYPRGMPPRHWVDQDDEDIMVPILFDAEPWSEVAIRSIESNYGADFAEAMTIWPSYYGFYKEPQFLTSELSQPYSDTVLRVWDGMPVDPHDLGVRDLQVAFFEMFAATGIDDVLLYYSNVMRDWWPDPPGTDPENLTPFEDGDAKEYQDLFEDLHKRGLVDADGEIGDVLRVRPVEEFLHTPDARATFKWWAQDLLYTSRRNRDRAIRVMYQDGNPFVEQEGLMSPWA